MRRGYAAAGGHPSGGVMMDERYLAAAICDYADRSRRARDQGSAESPGGTPRRSFIEFEGIDQLGSARGPIGGAVGGSVRGQFRARQTGRTRRHIAQVDKVMNVACYTAWALLCVGLARVAFMFVMAD